MAEAATVRRQDARREAIEKAAYEVLMEDGYKAASVLAIAKRAQASNETLYRWYGNKQGIFKALVARNAQAAQDVLDEALDQDKAPLAVLAMLGPVLLTLVTSERAVALNRAAAGDVHDTATLGQALADGGRNAVVPRIAELLSRAARLGELSIADIDEAADVYVSLLLGDLQIRRATGALDGLDATQIENRSQRALHLLSRLYAPS